MHEQTLRETVLQELSHRIARAIGAQPFQCAMNAWRALIEFPDLFQAGGRLVEGWYVIETEKRVTLNEHVWCTLPDRDEGPDGHIVDPSVLLLVPPTTPVFYYPGLTRTWAETEALEGAFFPHVRFDGHHGDDGLGHPGYKAAREAARRKVYALALQGSALKAMHFLTAQDLDLATDPPARQDADVAVRPPEIIGEPLDILLSLTTARYLRASPRRCWYNARDALLQMPAAFLSARYIEGWLVARFPDGIHLLEHGWVQTAHTGIVDPTIVLDEMLPLSLEYLPGFSLSWFEIQHHQSEPLPLARALNAQRASLLEYQQACQVALEKGEALAWQTGLPLLPEPGGMLTWYRNAEQLCREETRWEFPVPSTPSARDRVLAQHQRDTPEITIR